jgi:prepilin-type N-terminal cleavage/methylation domain-containing protein
MINEMSPNRNRKSFTLIELLVVLALVAILSVVVVMTLNPAELLKQARDSNRLSDLATINTSLNLFSTDLTNGFMGTSSIVYVSIPDNASSTCGSLGLPTLPAGWNYNCVTSQNLRNTDGTGWIPVNFQRIYSNTPISQLPIDPVNTTSTNSYYTYIAGGSWKLTAVSLESSKYQANTITDGGIAGSSFEMGNNFNLGAGIFPNGWIKVPGNSTFGTNDFWVMKYEAKCATSTTPGTGLTSPETGSKTYADNTSTCTGNRTVTSIPDGYPIANINHTNALARCISIGAHLLTNDEYMTITRNAEQIATNWGGGVVGTSYIYNGHSDSNPNYSLTASTNDADGYFGTGQSSGGQKRTLTLSNNQIIWDISGNLIERVQRSSQNIGDNISVMSSLPKCSDNSGSWGWCQFGNTNTPYISTWTSDASQEKIGPSNTTWNSTQGVGQVWTYKNGTTQDSSTFLRGGHWYSSSGAGIFSLAFGTPSGLNYDTGFRCAK